MEPEAKVDGAAPADIHIVDASGPHEQVTVELLRRQRLFEKMGVRVSRSWVTNGADAVERLLAGGGDAAVQIGFGPALSAIAGGAPLKVIAAANTLSVHALFSNRPGIRSLHDLPGRTVGIGKPGALTHQLVHAALRKHKVDPASVRFVTIGNSAAIFRALLAGEVEAGFGESEVLDHLAAYGVHPLDHGLLWEELPDFPNQASFATADAIRDRRPALVRMLAAHALLYRLLQSPDSWPAYAEAWTAALPEAPPEEGRNQWLFYQRHRPFAEDLRLPEQKVDYLQALNVEMGLQRELMPAGAIADMSLATDALRLLAGKSEAWMEDRS